MSELQPAAHASRRPLQRMVAQARGWSRFLVMSLLLHVPLFIYPVLRLCDWLELTWWLTLIILIPIASSQVVSRVYLRTRHGVIPKLLRQAADIFLGASPVFLVTLLAFEILVGLALIAPANAAVGVIMVGICAGICGMGAAMFPMVRTIALTSSKLTAPLRIVQISDVHIGLRNRQFLERIVTQVNNLSPDFLCITGDLVDGRGVPERDLRSLKSVAGPVYLSLGNHEKYEDLDSILDRLANLDVTVLRNSDMHFGTEVQVIGIDDMDDAGQVERQLSNIVVDDDAFVVLLYHRPRGLASAAAAGVDLMLSGHTHNGQIVPFNLAVRRAFDMVQGLFEHGETKLYVSQGTGTWGPVMRIGTRSEITLFEIAPAPGGADR